MQGFTDQSYADEQKANIEIPIHVLPVNDPPIIQSPDTVLNYAKGLRCRSDPIIEFRDPNGLICTQVRRRWW